MATLSVVTLTKNEANNIAECLETVRWADELIVIDSGSDDGTREAARRYTNKVFSIEWKGYGAARNAGIAHATGDWILWLDADERVTPELATDIQAILAGGDRGCAGFAIARRAYFLGRWIQHAGWYPSRVTRLFRKSQARFSETRVHEQLMVDGPVGRVEHDLMHYTDPDLDHYFTKFNLYTTLAAADMRAAGRSFVLTDLLLRPAFQFFKMYFLRRGFLDGMEGFILCVSSSAYVFTKYAKLWELKNK